MLWIVLKEGFFSGSLEGKGMNEWYDRSKGWFVKILGEFTSLYSVECTRRKSF